MEPTAGEAPELMIAEAFLDDHAVLFETLRDTVEWDRTMSARLTASYGRPYNYRQMVYAEAPMHPRLIPVVDRLEERTGVRFNNCLLNYYVDGRSKMGFHSDDVSELEPGSGVAIVSLGHARKITFRRRDDINVRWVRELPPGSLLHMQHAVQADWAHAIKRQRGAGPRISLTWRAFV